MIHSRIQTKVKEREGTERKRGREGEREKERGREIEHDFLVFESVSGRFEPTTPVKP